MSTATELTGLVQIDTERELVAVASADLGGMADGIVAFIAPDIGKKRTPAEIRKLFKNKEVQTLDKLSQALMVTDDDSFQTVGALVAEAAGIIKAIEVDIAPEKQTASELHKLLCDREAVAQAPYRLIKQAGDTSMNAYRVKQKREADELARKEQEEARKKQAKLDAEAAEQLRQVRELEAKALQAKRDGDMAASRQATQEAVKATQAAETLQEQAVAVVEEIQYAPAPVTKIAGRVEKWPWKGTVVDLKQLVLAVGSGAYPLEHQITVRGVTKTVPIFEVNPEVIEYYAKRLEANARIPGVKFEETLQTAQRTK